MATAIECGLVAALIAVAVVGAMRTLGGKIPDNTHSASPAAVVRTMAVARGNTAYGQTTDGTCWAINFSATKPHLFPVHCKGLPDPS